MIRKTRNLYIVGAAVLLLAAAAYFLTNRSKTSAEGDFSASGDGTDTITNLADIPPENLRGLSVENDTGKIALTSMDGETWLIGGIAKDFTPKDLIVRSMVENLARIPGRLVEEKPADPAMYGLEDPGSVVRLVSSDGKKSSIEFGITAPSGDGHYARIPGSDAVYLVDSNYSSKAFWKLNDLRETRLPEVDTQALTSITVVLKGRTVFKAEQHTADLDPFRPLGSSLDIVEPWEKRQLIDEQRFAEFLQNNPPPSLIAGFPEVRPTEREAGFGLDSDRIVLASGDGGRLDLEIGKSGKEEPGVRFAREEGNRDEIFFIDDTDLGLLKINSFELTSPFVFLAGIDRVREIRITGGESPVILSIQKLGDPEDDSDDVFTVNSKELSEKDFKKLYQSVISLLHEGTVEKAVPLVKPKYRMEFVHVDTAIRPAILEYFDYNDTYLTAGLRGEAPEFIIGRYQLKLLMDALDSVINKP